MGIPKPSKTVSQSGYDNFFYGHALLQRSTLPCDPGTIHRQLSALAPAQREQFLRNVALIEWHQILQMFVTFRNRRLKIRDGTFAGMRCHYNDCSLCTAVNNNKHFIFLCFVSR